MGGGNFAYSVQEGHAYAAVSPVVQHVSTPVAVSYETPAVVPSTYAIHSLPAAPITLDAPRYEIKTVETPTAFKTLNLASPYYAPYAPFGHYGSYQIVEAAAPAEE